MSELEQHAYRKLPLPAGYDETNAVVFSSTQFKTYQLCPRKWAFEYAWGLPSKDNDAFKFGTTLHSCNERFLKADDLGRDENGNPVELFPEGWDSLLGSDKVSADLVQKLVRTAVEKGILVRRPNRKIEHSFIRELTRFQDVTIFVQGFIDVLHPAEIEDHKTSKTRKYAKSPRELRECPQMLTYAREALVRAEEEGRLVPESIKLRHNYFIKDPSKPAVFIKEAEVSVDEVLQHWEYLKIQAVEMVRVGMQNLDPFRWHDVDGPSQPASACLKYGRCSYISVCSGQLNPEEYTQMRTNEQKKKENGKMPGPIAPNLRKAPPAGAPAVNGTAPGTAPVAAAAVARKPGPPAGPKPPVKAATPPPAAPPEGFWITDGDNEVKGPFTRQKLQELIDLHYPIDGPCLREGDKNAQGEDDWTTCDRLNFKVSAAAPEASDARDDGDDMQTPPWAHPNCTACEKNREAAEKTGTAWTPGFNSKGNPCHICDTEQQKSGGLMSHKFKITTAGDGTVSWTQRETATVAELHGTTTRVGEGVTNTGTAPLPGAAAEPTANATPQTEPAPTGEQQPVSRGRGRPPGSKNKPRDGAPGASPAAPTEPAAAAPRLGPALGGFVLVTGGASVRTTGKVHDLVKVLHEHGAKLAEASQQPTYYHLNPFDRRDLLAQRAAEIAAEFGADFVLANGDGPDFGAFLTAIRPYAAAVIE